jgi:hypothetical protein
MFHLCSQVILGLKKVKQNLIKIKKWWRLQTFWGYLAIFCLDLVNLTWNWMEATLLLHFVNLDKNTSWFLIMDIMSSKHSPNDFCNDALYGRNILCTTNQNCWFFTHVTTSMQGISFYKNVIRTMGPYMQLYGSNVRVCLILTQHKALLLWHHLTLKFYVNLVQP